MMNIKITPSLLNGNITIPPSKSISHRALICASLAGGKSTINNLLDCADTRATISALKSLGADIIYDGKKAFIDGIKDPVKKAFIDCNESGSTLRFMVPVAAALGIKCTFDGKGKLPTRPLTPYFTELEKNGIIFVSKKMPYEISGKLQSGEYIVSGNISSQFITGLLFALPLLQGNSVIKLSSPLESKPYVDITIDCLKRYGVHVYYEDNAYYVNGGQRYQSCDYSVECDWSQAAFFTVANTIGSKINIDGMNYKSVQGDSEIANICNKSADGKPFDVDGRQIPDIIPILAVLASFSKGTSYIRNCGRLRIKECDRLNAISDVINTLGGKVTVKNDDLIINGVENFNGGTVSSYNDHRIAMCAAILSTRCTDTVTITDAGCVKKSYPGFFDDFTKLGGKVNVIEL